MKRNAWLSLPDDTAIVGRQIEEVYGKIRSLDFTEGCKMNPIVNIVICLNTNDFDKVLCR